MFSFLQDAQQLPWTPATGSPIVEHDVPPFRGERTRRVLSPPLNAPRVWPNNSPRQLIRNRAQLNLTSGAQAGALRMQHDAISSLPVPVSPRTRRYVFFGPPSRHGLESSALAGDSPRSVARKVRGSLRSSRIRIVFSPVASVASNEVGYRWSTDVPSFSADTPIGVALAPERTPTNSREGLESS